MTVHEVETFDHVIIKTRQWLTEIAGGLDGADMARAWRVLRAVLHALRDRLPLDVLAHFSAQLPMLVRGAMFEGWDPTGKPERIDRGEFLVRVRREAHLDSITEAKQAVEAVVAVLWTHVSEGVMRPVAESLPRTYEDLVY
jgi:uncharacterized protein (DUF2267 family)